MSTQNSTVDSPQEVEAHLKRLRTAIESPDCIIDLLMCKKGETELSPYSTAFTLQTLEYVMDDIKKELSELQVKDYIETMTDTVKTGTKLYVFGVQIKNRNVYIKEKLRTDNHIFCISFHFAKYNFEKKPYDY